MNQPFRWKIILSEGAAISELSNRPDNECATRNEKRLGAKLSPYFYQQLGNYYQDALNKLLPIKERLRKTDMLIDQVVYKLYGLTEKEIAIVEGRREGSEKKV